MGPLSGPFGFGPLNALHRKLLAADDIDLTALVMWAVAMAPLLPQAYLLLSPGTRRARAALGALGVGLVINVWMRYRFVDPAYNSANCFLTAGAMFIAIRYVEWGLLTKPIVDPWMLPQHGRRNRLLAALDLTLNTRGVFLGSYGLDSMAGSQNGSHAVCEKCARICAEDKDGGCESSAPLEAASKRAPAKSKIKVKSAPPRGPVTVPPAGSHLPQPTGRPTDRAEAIRRHFFDIVWRFVLVDVVSSHTRLMAHDTIQLPGGMPGAVDAFSSRVGIRLLPMLPLPLEVPSFVLGIIAELVIPTVVCLWLGIIYHAAAMIALTSTFWEPASWDVDLFDSPFLATSLIDGWGKRWHHVLRHTFVVLATSTIHLLHLPHTTFAIVPLAFFYSGVFHALAHLSMDPVPENWKILAFFTVSGLGCVAEVLFKRITGRRVGGWAGRIWAGTFTLILGRLVMDAWLDAGFAALFRLPPGGIGDIISSSLWRWVYVPFRRDM